MQHPADNYGMFAAAQPLPNATRRVLVIDDDPAVLKVLGLVLQRRGFSVDRSHPMNPHFNLGDWVVILAYMGGIV